ncbi:MAG: hypothetical protein P8J74_03360 [Woeseiaceae bacterium]|nr:hypothetical protein [Woeseiaceae bacterium]
MIDGVLTLFKTFIEIIFFYKGPRDIPNSSVLLLMVFVFWCLIGVIASIFMESNQTGGLLFDLMLIVFGLAIYALIINSFGQSERIIRCFTAILGCSLIFSIVLLLAQVCLSAVLTSDETRLAVQIIWLWSIPVEGHIIARTIDRHWVFGFLIAITVLFAQLQLFVYLSPMFGSIS